MRIFVGEFICGGGLANQELEELPLEMRQEGEAMLRAIVEDLSEFSETTVILDSRFPIPFEFSHVVPFKADKPLWAQWVDAARGCDAAIVVAPETDGILAKGVSALRSSEVNVIASSGNFLRASSDKLLTAQRLHRASVAHPPYVTLEDRRMESVVTQFDSFVVKPRDGCGTQAIELFDDFDSANDALCDNTILQVRVPGKSVSVSLVSSGTHQTFLPAVTQHISEDCTHYLGGCGPLSNKLQRRASLLASRAIEALPPTAKGFVGVDLILGANSHEDYVIEINPRLTTSYVGLRKMIHGNLAARLFDIETGPVSCKASVNSVHWTHDGKVSGDTAAVAS